MLSLEHVQAWYGRTQALFDVSLEVVPGEVLALVGTNGAGKSSTIRATLGLIRSKGTVTMYGTDVTAWSTHRRVREFSIGVVPESKSLFPAMTVRENMLVGQTRTNARNLDRAIGVFPMLESRLSTDVGALSGGQRQMVALARTLMRTPRILLLDEPGLGLAPVIVDDIYARIRQLLNPDLAVVLVEQSAARVASLADQVRLISIGRSGDQVAASDAEGLRRLEAIAFGG
ncbi:ABC transporter ATP-binding protein [Microbacterium sp. P01]|uniref:ABC transporter ATP-binding protein n=1 Tax=Microbacterium sp. P01 TaxID=3366261 RepID=UPI00366CB99B